MPDRLPMVYESVMMPPRENDNDEEDNDKSIRSWDSPMSPSAQATRLDLEVIAIFTTDEAEKVPQQQQKQQSVAVTVPSMAMVVVRKANNKNEANNNIASPMMQNLFDDSEKRILRALDRGLDDFMDGKIPLEGLKGEASKKNSQQPSKEKETMKSQEDALKAAQDAMIEELLEDAAESHPSVVRESNEDLSSQQGKKSHVVDADFSRVKDTPHNSKSTKKKKAMKAPELDSTMDFAIQAAAKLAAEQKKNINKEETPTSEAENKKALKENKSADFAVAAARRVANANKAAAAKAKKLETKNKKSTAAKKPVNSEINPPMDSPLESMEREPGLLEDGGGHKRSFRTTISTPKAFTSSKKQQSKQSSGKSDQKEELRTIPTTAAIPSSNAKQAKPLKNGASKKQQEQTRKLNLKVVDEDGNELDPATKDKKVDSAVITDKPKVADKKTKSKKSSKAKPSPPTEQDIMKTAQDVMSELAEQGADMTPEELLEDVLKFGEKKDQEDEVGSGFVSGAFEMAKELLREQKQKRETQMAVQKADSQIDTPRESAKNGSPRVNVKEREISTEEEELRKMFEAGERLADGRITVATAEEKGTPMTDEEEEVVDELIAGDKSVSDHARVLDDELAELEVRIRQTPGEENDGPSFEKNPLFDIFSGPEVYNPNVDPEDTVNWPGAKPFTKSNAVEAKLPKELSEAVKYARFASEVLQKLEVRGEEEKKTYFVGKREMSQMQIGNLQTVVNEAVELGIIPNPLAVMEERARLQMVLDELQSQPEERFREILSNYKELLLSDNFVDLIKERLQAMADRDLDSLRKRSDDNDNDVELEKAHAREREILGQLVVNAQLLLKETRALGAELETQQIEVIRSICKVAMDPSHTTEEEAAAALTDAVRDMRPLFDEMFVAYLKFAVAEEEGKLARAGVLDDPEHNQWLFVLKIVQQGVYAEIAKGINRYIEHIWYILRMETATERRMLLSKLIDVMPTLDVRPFVQVVDNIVGSLGEAAKGEFDGGYELGKMTNKLLQLHRDMKELLPPDRIDLMSRDADEWAAKQKERMLEQRNLTKQRLKAARDTESYDAEIEELGKRGEIERFD